MIELLAPAGSVEVAEAAILAGADAIYLGLKSFSARAYASNFSWEDLDRIIDLAHFYQTQVHVTMNTLMTTKELAVALDTAHRLYQMQVDALIVQDLGFIRQLRRQLSPLALHASTQMNIHSLYGAQVVEGLGMKRVVLARETPLEVIREIKEQTQLEVEGFIHGSLCVSQSGICYMSNQIGGRSGNRGACAGPCRKNYRLLDRQKKEVGPARAYLSARDLSTLDQVQDLVQLGLDSLKIEGRMKSPDYVYSVVKNYKKALAGQAYDSGEIEETQNRKFTRGLALGDFGPAYSEVDRASDKGRQLGQIIESRGQKKVHYYHAVKTGDIFLVETQAGQKIPLTATADHPAQAQVAYGHLANARVGSPVKRVQSMALKRELTQAFPRKDLWMEVTLRLGQRPVLRAWDDQHQVEVQNDYLVAQAQSQPLGPKDLQGLLGRLGQSPYRLAGLKIHMDQGVFLPRGVVNQLRRQAVAGLVQARRQLPGRPALGQIPPSQPIEARPQKTFQALEGSLADHKILSPEGYFYVLPSFMRAQDYEALVGKFRDDPEFLGFYGKNLGDLAFAQDKFPDKEFRFDYFINAWNLEAIQLLKDLGASAVTLPIELGLEELDFLVDQSPLETELLLDYPIIVMNNLFCPFSIIYPACRRHCSTCTYRQGYLVDSYEKEFRVDRRGQVSEIYFYKNYRAGEEGRWKKSKLNYGRYEKEG